MENRADNSAWLERLGGPEEVRDAALGELRGILVRGLRTAVSGRGGDASFCEDVAQEALLKILANINQFAGRSRFTTWALTIAVRVALTELRRREFEHLSLDAAIADADIPTVLESRPEEPSETKEYRTAVLTELRRMMKDILTEHQRTAIQCLLLGLPAEEIGRRVGISRNAAYKLVYDARTRLREGFERAGYDPKDVLSAFP